MRRMVALVLILTACSQATEPTNPPLIVNADRFDNEALGGCAEALTEIQRGALEVVSPWGLGGGMDSLGGVAVTTAAAQEADGATFSRTNVQEAGIDEADVIKTDGDVVVVLTGSRLHVLDAEPRLRLRGTIDLAEFGPSSIFLYGDRVLAVGAGVFEAQPQAGAAFDMIWQPPDSIVAMVDISDRGAPRVVETVELSGNLLASRLEGSTMRLVVGSSPRHLPFVVPDPQAEPVGAAETRALSRNRSVIINSSIEDWFPRYRHEILATGVINEGPIVGCDGVAAPGGFNGFSTTTILSFDLEAGLAPVDSFGLASDSHTVYAAPGSIYLASQLWRQPDERHPGITSSVIHRFATTDRDVTFTGTGEVPGWLYSQWAMSDDGDGHLRVASTTSTPWAEGRTESIVSILDTEDMGVVGSIGGLGIEEQIYAVRFMGDLAYVVTFRQVDPLYVVDLSDPRSPEVAGELKIPGYSAYLHPVGDGLLVGVGQDADLNGQVLGTQVALFDVSDPFDPVQVDKLTYRGAYSAAEWDHHAFLYWQPTGTLLVPLQGGSRSETLAVTVQGDDLDETARVDIDGYAMRNVVVGDRILSLSDWGLVELGLDGFEELGSVRLP